jgi:subtilisin family serine protease
MADGGYATWSGTSMAAGLTAGEVALVRAAFPRLGHSNVISQVVSTSANIGGPVPRRLDAAAAVTSRPR